MNKHGASKIIDTFETYHSESWEGLGQERRRRSGHLPAPRGGCARRSAHCQPDAQSVHLTSPWRQQSTQSYLLWSIDLPRCSASSFDRSICRGARLARSIYLPRRSAIELPRHSASSIDLLSRSASSLDLSARGDAFDRAWMEPHSDDGGRRRAIWI
jgi:hypothetical protein